MAVTRLNPTHAKLIRESCMDTWEGNVSFVGLDWVEALVSESVFAYIENGKIIGVVHIEDSDDGIFINRLAVRHDRRQKGIGHELLSAVTALQASSLKKVFLDVGSENEPAIHLYKKNGFNISATFGHGLYEMERLP